MQAEGLVLCPLWNSPSTTSTHLVLELVAVLVLLLVEVDEVVRDPVSATAVHLPADPERVTGDMTDPDLPRDWQVVHVPKAPARRLCAKKTDISAPHARSVTVPCDVIT